MVTNLLVISHDLATSTDHDDLLFDAQVNTGFTGLFHLSNMTWPDKIALHNYKKITT
jgi:sorbitol-specific phosphotransferase system component IIA